MKKWLVLCVAMTVGILPGCGDGENAQESGDISSALAAALPAPWTGGDVGAVGLAGTASATGSVFTISAAGGNIFDNADSFYFVSQPLSGDGQIVARVTSLQNTDPWAKAGVMIRETLDPASAHATVVITSGNGAVAYDRPAKGAATDKVLGGNATVPAWVKLARVGNQFTASLSSDGTTWTIVNAVTLTLATSARVGLVVTSHNPATLASASFDNVLVSGATPPGVVPSPWKQTDVGTVGVAGGGSANGAAFAVSGSGSNIFDASDSFHLVYQPLTGDGQITARVDSIQATDDFAKAGVMIRASTASNSIHAAMVMTANAGPFLYDRPATGASTDKVAGPGGVALPRWVRLARSGNLVMASISSNGSNWTAVGQVTLPLPSTALVGLAVTSHDNSRLSAAAFSQVQVAATTAPPPPPPPPPPPGDDTRSAGCGKTPGATGRLTLQKITVGSRSRTFTINIPAGYDSSKAVSLVLIFHGMTGTGTDEHTYWQMEETVGNNALVVYPDGLPRPNQSNQTGWDLSLKGDDLPFFDALVTQLKNTYCLDPRRIFSTGFSYGGYFSNLLGCVRGDVLRAVAPMSGGGPTDDDTVLGGALVKPKDLACQGTVAVMVTHGLKDSDVWTDTGRASRDYWIAKNSCKSTSTAVVTAPTTADINLHCVAYDGCAVGRPVWWCEHGLGHENKLLQPQQSKNTWQFFSGLPIP